MRTQPRSGRPRKLDDDIRDLLMQEQINRSRRTIMVLDNAPFHKVKVLNWGRIEPLYLPVYSPDLNSIETLWLAMKKRFFNGWCQRKTICWMNV